MLFKYVVKNVAHQAGKTATFMPKPIFGDNGSGMHVHQSLWKDGEPLFYDEKGYGGLSDMARWYIGGLLKHAPSLLAFTNPTVNSYHRLVPGFEAPVNLVYSARNRSACIRIPVTGSNPKAKRIEFRVPDPSSNPYLAFSGHAHGRPRRHQEPDRAAGAGRQGPLRAAARGARADRSRSPASLAEVLDALEADHDYLTAGGVFTARPHRDVDRLQARERGRPDPPAPAPARVRALLRLLTAAPRDPLPERARGRREHHGTPAAPVATGVPWCVAGEASGEAAAAALWRSADPGLAGRVRSGAPPARAGGRRGPGRAAGACGTVGTGAGRAGPHPQPCARPEPTMPLLPRRPLPTALLGAGLATVLGVLAVAGAGPAAAGRGPDRVPTPGTPRILATGFPGTTSIAVRDRRTVAVASFDGAQLVSRGTVTSLVGEFPEDDFRHLFEKSGLAWDGDRLVYTVFGHLREIDGAMLLVRTPDGASTQIADLGETGFEDTVNPDGVNTYGYLGGLSPECEAQFFHDNPFEFHGTVYDGDLDSRPLATAVAGGTVYVADGDANDVLALDADGLRLVAVLPPVVAPMTAEAGPSQENTPECALGHPYAFEPRPSDVEVGRDGTLYVTTRTESPDRPLGSLYAIDPATGALRVAVGGLVGPHALALGPRGEVYLAEAHRISVVPRGSTTPVPFLDLAGVQTLEVHGKALFLVTPDGDLLRVPIRR